MTNALDTHGDWIYDNVAAYLNVDVGVGGTGFGASATHSLDRYNKDNQLHSIISQFLIYPSAILHRKPSSTSLQIYSSLILSRVIKSVADDIIDPNTSKPLSQVWNGKVDTLGSGSDYTAYIHHYGIPSASFGFFGDAEAGVWRFHGE